MSMEFTIHPILAKLILRFNPFHRILVVCLGYNGDYEEFTELVWADDKDLDFTDRETYPEFQLWICPKYKEKFDYGDYVKDNRCVIHVVNLDTNIQSPSDN